MIFIKDVKETAKMTNTDILLEDLEDVLDDATSIPLRKKLPTLLPRHRKKQESL